MKSICAIIPAVLLLAPLKLGSQISDLRVEVIEVPPGDYFLRWQAKAGHTYFIQTSDPNSHLETWIWSPSIERSEIDTEISYETGATAGKAFFRLHHTDQSPPPGVSLEDWDADGDGLSNAFELHIQTNPLSPDTSGDGIPDGWAFVHGLDPRLDNSAGIFQFSGITNLAAHQAGVQAHPNATLDNFDGDALNNDEDVDPHDIELNWQRAGNAAYVLIDLDIPAGAGEVQDINDKGEVLFEHGIWSGGNWIPKEAPPITGSFAINGGGEQEYEVEVTGWRHFNSDRKLLGSADFTFTSGQAASGDGMHTVATWSEGQSPNNLAAELAYYGNYFYPLGVDDTGQTFAYMVKRLGPSEERWSKIAVFDANGDHLSLRSGAGGYHPTGGGGHFDVSDNGWSVSNTSDSLSTPTSHRLGVWNNAGTLMSMPEQAEQWFFPIFLADLPSNQTIVVAGTDGGLDSQVFRHQSAGAMEHLPSLSGKKIRLFAGDGTAMTGDGRLWRNGDFIPMCDLCPQWAEMEDDEWNLQPLKANKHGVYLIQTEGPQNQEATKLAIKIVVSPANPDSGLRVAKMENSLSAEGELNIDADPDRFHIRIPGGAKLGTISAELATVDNEDPDYDDGPTTIDLVENGDDQVSQSLLLVSDDVDDACQGNGVGVADRTHKISLGGKVKVSSVRINGSDYDATYKNEVLALKKISGRIILVGDTSDDALVVFQLRKIAKERYAQLGLVFDLTIATMEFPNDVNPELVHFDGGVAGSSGQGGNVMHEDMRKIIAKAELENKRDKITVFVVPDLEGTYNGRAYTERYTAPIDQTRVNTVVLSAADLIHGVSMYRFTLPHEVGHLLTNHGHFGSDYGNAPAHKTSHNIMRDGGTSAADSITASKRFYELQNEMLVNELLDDL